MDHVITNAQTGEVTVVPFTSEEIASHQELSLKTAWVSLRSKRDTLLSQSDIYILPDRWATYTSEKQTEWSQYRQALRNLPQNITDPFNAAWPTKPD